jgi:hypothetical protein
MRRIKIAWLKLAMRRKRLILCKDSWNKYRMFVMTDAQKRRRQRISELRKKQQVKDDSPRDVVTFRNEDVDEDDANGVDIGTNVDE